MVATVGGMSRCGRRRTACIDGPDPIDVHVGGRIRLRRTLLGLTQNDLGDALSLTPHQIRKYERGTNRVAAATLYRLARILDVPVGFFFENMPGTSAVAIRDSDREFFSRGESLQLLRLYYRIPESARRRVFHIIEALTRE